MTAVTHETTDNSSTYTVVTNRGSISCSRVVHATNAYASYLLPFLAGPDGIIPTRGQVMATRASVGSDQIKKPSWSGNEVSHTTSACPVVTNISFRGSPTGSLDL